MNYISVPEESQAREDSSTLNQQTQDDQIYPFMVDDDADGPSPPSPESLSSTPAPGPKKRQPRKFKGRAPRACFCCRARKVRCNVAECGVPCYNCQRDDVTCTVPKHRGSRRVAKERDWRKTYFNSKCGQDTAPELLPSPPATSLDLEDCRQPVETEPLGEKDELPKDWDPSLDEGDLTKGLELGFRLMARFLDQFSASLAKIRTANQRQSRSPDVCNHRPGAHSGADENFNMLDEDINWMGSQGTRQDLDFDFAESTMAFSEEQAESFSPSPSDCQVRTPPSTSSCGRTRQRPPSDAKNSQVLHKYRTITALVTRAFEAAIREAEPRTFETQLSNSAFSDIGSDEAVGISTPSDMEIPQLQPERFLQPADRRAKDDALVQEQIAEFLIRSDLDTVSGEYGEEESAPGKGRGPDSMDEGFDEQVAELFDGIMEYRDGETASMFRVEKDVCNILL